MGCGSTLTATFVRLALGACQDWKWRQVAPKIIAAPLQQAANSAATPLHTLNKLLVWYCTKPLLTSSQFWYHTTSNKQLFLQSHFLHPSSKQLFLLPHLFQRAASNYFWFWQPKMAFVFSVTWRKSRAITITSRLEVTTPPVEDVRQLAGIGRDVGRNFIGKCLDFWCIWRCFCLN